MNRLKWIDLFRFLNERASDMPNLGKFDWQAPVIVYDANTGEELTCDTYYFVTDTDTPKNRFVLMINLDNDKASDNGL